MEVWIVYEGDPYDTRNFVRQVFTSEEDGKTYMESILKLEGKHLWMDSRPLISYGDKDPDVVVQHYIHVADYKYGKMPIVTLETRERMREDVPGNMSVFAGKGSIHVWMAFPEKKELNEEKAFRLFDEIREELTSEDLNNIDTNHSRQALFKRFETKLHQLFKS
ncbi:hypothetical protein IMZ31_19420 (plasmid) [Pontibacillus sp. ALD_SL1]|uniref:hypothetical protein n=1 Tax=Pontibacillus sp. ALD_SL1 TaxID=2777185 RepID=UPI001A964D4C|nr:hypothetical protein [Pontibacillus sp. ALD_SL1]QST02721.1 hypothetical protein IMZ31_19420 [Pontibacillus sp. ALD_SL1]